MPGNCLREGVREEVREGNDFRKKIQEQFSGKNFRKKFKEKISGENARKEFQDKNLYSEQISPQPLTEKNVILGNPGWAKSQTPLTSHHIGILQCSARKNNKP